MIRLRSIAALLSVALASGAAALTTKQPRLVLVIVIDQFGLDLFLKARPHLGRQGLVRLWEEGTHFADATYRQAAAYTAPGHACIATGSYPDEDAVVGNVYFDRASNKTVPILYDPEAHQIGGGVAPEEGVSPRFVDAETIGDRLRIATGMKAKVVSVAMKDRSAILLGGRLGQAFYFRTNNGTMATSSAYMASLPPWVQAFNDRKLADDYFGKTWDRALPLREYPPWEGPRFQNDVLGLGVAFPHHVTGPLGKISPEFYSALAITPFSNDIEVAFAKAAIDALKLGQNTVPDLLAVSFTAPDYIGHAFGPQSQEALDSAVRVDQAVAALLKAAETAAGKGNLLVVFTADHGAPPVPEFLIPFGFDAGRMKPGTVRERVSNALARTYGPGEYVPALDGHDLYLDHALIAKANGDLATASRIAASAAQQIPGMAWAWAQKDIAENEIPQIPPARAAQLCSHRDRSGDVFLVSRPFYLLHEGFHGERHGTSHGAPYRYDTTVPLAFWGTGIGPKNVLRPVEIADIAPTLGELLGIGEPAAAEGHSIPEVFASKREGAP